MLELIIHKMTLPRRLEARKQYENWYVGRGDFYNGVYPERAVFDYDVHLLSQDYKTDQDFVNLRFSIEFVTFALRLMEIPIEWKRYAVSQAMLPDSNKDETFLNCLGAIRLMRYFLLVIVDIYRTFEVYETLTGHDFRWRNGKPLATTFRPQVLFETRNFMKSVREAQRIANNTFTNTLNTTLGNIGVDRTYMSPSSIIADKRLWSVLI